MLCRQKAVNISQYKYHPHVHVFVSNADVTGGDRADGTFRKWIGGQAGVHVLCHYYCHHQITPSRLFPGRTVIYHTRLRSFCIIFVPSCLLEYLTLVTAAHSLLDFCFTTGQSCVCELRVWPRMAIMMHRTVSTSDRPSMARRVILWVLVWLMASSNAIQLHHK